jgi:hypothetical protein
MVGIIIGSELGSLHGLRARATNELEEDAAPESGRVFGGGIYGLTARLTGTKGAVAASAGVHTFATITAADIGNLVGAV